MSSKKINTGAISQGARRVDVVSPVELHVCMGLNCCKGHDRFGTNDCAGTGECATAKHACHTLNNCRGQGGCGLYGSAEEQKNPGANDCSWRGSCATPIDAERIHLQGDEKIFLKSVWKNARCLFEKRMQAAGREYGKPRFPDGPPTWWLEAQVGGFDACGASGPRDGSFTKFPDCNCTEGCNDCCKDKDS